MRSFFCLLFCLVYSTLSAQDQSEANELLQALVDDSGIVGITAGYSVEGTIEWKASEGLRCREESLPFTDTTLTRAASIAKSMTAVAVLQLVEQGKLELDDPIGAYLTRLPEDKVGITVRQLLSHTSGLSQYQNTREVENQTEFADLAAAMEVFIDRPLLFEPGMDFFYTSYGYVVLGRVIEEASGVSYEAYMKENIWKPAGMLHTGVEKSDHTYPGKSCLYHKNRRKAKEATANNLSNRIPGGGFYTNLQDMLRFGQAVMNGSLISEDSLNEMIQNQFEGKEGNPYGLGWFLYGPPPHEGLVVGHSGEQTGCSSQLMLIPKSQTVVVVLANTSGAWKDVVQYASQLIRISEQR